MINWFEVAVEKPKTYSNLFKLPNDIYIQRIRDIDSSLWGVTHGASHLLIGTFNKMLGYLSDVFEIMFDAYKLKLNETEILIVSGYGFGDKGINSKLSNWLNLTVARKMVIIHPYKEDLLKNSRGHFHLNFMNSNWKHSKVELIEKKFEEVTYDEINKAIQN